MAQTRTYLATSAVLGAGGVALGLSGLGPLFFASSAAPALLGAGGASLPGLWWLMQTIPPKPKLIDFPAIRLLFNLSAEDKQSASIPLWQRLLRLGAVSAAVIGLADPQFEAPGALGEGSGPVLIVVDNGWESAKNWNDIQRRIEGVLKTASRQGRSVMILPTAPEFAAERKAGTLREAREALGDLPSLSPHPWPADHAAALRALADQKLQGASVIWFSNGQNDPRVPDFVRKLEGIGNVSVFKGLAENAAHLLSARPGNELGALVHRLAPGPEEAITITASGENGAVLTQAQAHFLQGSLSAEVVFDVPPELRRQIAKLSVPGEDHAGAVLLLDESWRKRSVGLLAGQGEGSLLQDSYYIKPAVAPFTDLYTGSTAEILKHNLSVVIMTDEAVLGEDDRRQLEDWVKKGGMLLRFAGPKLAAQPQDSLVPLPLIAGENHMGGELSGNTARGLAPFPANSPLAGMKRPESLSVHTRVLPETTPSGLPAGTEIWAEFEDGVPFISARHQGDGWSVLVHSTAGMDWSNLPLAEDFFLEMMKSIITRSKSAGAKAELTKPLPPLNVLDAHGRLGAPTRGNIELTRQALKDGYLGPVSPPGFYGESSFAKLAYNLSRAVPEYKALGDLPPSIKQFAVEGKDDASNAKGWLLLLATLMLLADLGARIQQSGMLPGALTKEPEGP